MSRERERGEEIEREREIDREIGKGGGERGGERKMGKGGGRGREREIWGRKRERKREREMGKGRGERGGEERERVRGSKGMLLLPQCFQKRGGVSEETNSGKITVKIHIKAIEEEKALNRYYNSTYRSKSPTSRLVPSITMNLHGHCNCPCQSMSS